MNYYAALFLIISALAGVSLLFLFLHRRRRKRLMERIEALPFPTEFDAILSRLPHHGYLEEREREAIRRLILRFVHTKNFVGIDLVVTDEMRVIIAFYACLLLLRHHAILPYPDLGTILIYPDSLLIEQQRNRGGIVTSEEVEIDGQSADGTIVITWDAAYREALLRGEDNLILHEFAHELDFMNGEGDGVPPMEASLVDRWTDVLDEAFDELCARVRDERDMGIYDLFGPDAAHDESEFFAVATERFFGVPTEFADHFPELYDQFRRFYGIDAADIFSKNHYNSVTDYTIPRIPHKTDCP